MTPEWNDEFYGVPNEVRDRAQTEKYNDSEEYKCYGWQNRREEFFVRRVRTKRRKGRPTTTGEIVSNMGDDQ